MIMADKNIKITLVRSVAGSLPKQRATIKALGLGKMHSSVVHEATPATLGMVRKVAHMVKVEEI